SPNRVEEGLGNSKELPSRRHAHQQDRKGETEQIHAAGNSEQPRRREIKACHLDIGGEYGNAAGEEMVKRQSDHHDAENDQSPSPFWARRADGRGMPPLLVPVIGKNKTPNGR